MLCLLKFRPTGIEDSLLSHFQWLLRNERSQMRLHYSLHWSQSPHEHNQLHTQKTTNLSRNWSSLLSFSHGASNRTQTQTDELVRSIIYRKLERNLTRCFLPSPREYVTSQIALKSYIFWLLHVPRTIVQRNSEYGVHAELLYHIRISIVLCWDKAPCCATVGPLHCSLIFLYSYYLWVVTTAVSKGGIWGASTPTSSCLW